ncbi:MAG: HepT-like ribonuclease domain-containing protein [Candidatus Nanopelagicales bacterium]
MTRTPEESLREAQAHFALMHQHAQGDLTDQLVIDAICMRLSAGLEALARLDTPIRDRLFGDEWPLMWGMRNRIAHGYLLVDTNIVRRTLQHDIPPVMARIEAELTDAG